MNSTSRYRRLQILRPIFENHLFLNPTRPSLFLNFAHFSSTNHAFIICEFFTDNIIQYDLQDVNDFKM